MRSTTLHPAMTVASVAAAGKEGADKMTPVLVDGDYDGATGCTAGSSYPNNTLPLAQMRGSIRAYLGDYQRTPDPNIIGRTALSVVGEILSCSITDPSRGLSTISRESSRFAALSDAGKRNISWELLEDIIPLRKAFADVERERRRATSACSGGRQEDSRCMSLHGAYV